MTDGELRSLRRKSVLGVIAASTCLGLTAWGAAASAAPANLTATSVMPAASTHVFCDDVSAAMVSLAGPDPTRTMNLARARYTFESLLTIGIKNFAALETEAPTPLKQPISLVVADFRTYEARTMRATSVGQLLDSAAQANPVNTTAYQHLVGFTATSC